MSREPKVNPQHGRKANQKMKPYLVMEYLMRHTDENHTIPFIIVAVPQHSIPVMPGVFRLCAVLLAYPCKQFLSCHPIASPLFYVWFVQRSVAQILASDNSPRCIDIRNHPAQHLSLPADQSSPGQISSWKQICSERTLVADMQSHETYKIGKASKIILASALFWT